MPKTVTLNKNRRRNSYEGGGSAPPPIPKLAELCTAAEKQPKPANSSSGFVEALDDIANQISAIEMNYAKQLGKELERVVQKAHQLEKDFVAWKEFCAAPKWLKFKTKKPSSDEPKKHLYNVMRYVCGPTENQQKNASFYLKVIDFLLADEVRDHRIAYEIEKRGGLRAIADVGREDNEGLKDKPNAKATGKPTAKAAMSGGSGNFGTSGQGERKRKSEVHVESTSEEFDLFMQLKEGDLVDCRIEAIETDDKGFVRLRFEGVDKV